MEYTDREKKAIENIKDELHINIGIRYIEVKSEYLEIFFHLLEKQNKELEMYKRISEMNLKDGEEFKNEMCNHRCVLKSNLEENYISKDKIRKNIKELNDNRPYLSKFDDWKEKEYTNEDINNMCVEVLEDLLGDE